MMEANIITTTKNNNKTLNTAEEKNNSKTPQEKNATYKPLAMQNKGKFWENIKNLLDKYKNNPKNSTHEQVWSSIHELAQHQTLSFSNSTYQERSLQKLIKGIIIDNNAAENLSTNINNKCLKNYLIGAGLLVAGAATIATTFACTPAMIATLGMSCAEPVAMSSALCSTSLGWCGARHLTHHALPIKYNNVNFKETISSLKTQLENRTKNDEQWNKQQAQTFIKECVRLQDNLSSLANNITLSPSNALEVLSYIIQIQDLLVLLKEQKTLPPSAIDANYNKSRKEHNNNTSSNNLSNNNMDPNIDNIN